MQLITGKTKLLGVIGHPVEHSLSPIMHNAAIATLGLDYAYVPLPVEPRHLEVALAGFAAVGVIGFSVTIPHKQAVIPLLSEVSPLAQSVGAVNAVYRNSTGSFAGTNTDIAGFLSPLETEKRDWSQTVAVILGNGGAARAVVAGCAKLGCAAIHVVGRNEQKLSAFHQSWLNSPLAVAVQVHPWQELPNLLPQADLLVNTTPIGMYPHVDESPLDAALMAKLPRGAIAYDLIYTPNPTRFLQLALAQGAVAIDGLEMLVQQGAVALQMWLQHEVPVDVMRQALREHLGL